MKCAGGIVRSCLSVPETVSLQLTARITSTARISINRFLTSTLGAPVFADDIECMKLDLVEILPTYHGTYDELIPIEIMISQDKLHQVYLKLSKRCGRNPTDVAIHC